MGSTILVELELIKVGTMEDYHQDWVFSTPPPTGSSSVNSAKENCMATSPGLQHTTIGLLQKHTMDPPMDSAILDLRQKINEWDSLENDNDTKFECLPEDLLANVDNTPKDKFWIEASKEDLQFLFCRILESHPSQTGYLREFAESIRSNGEGFLSSATTKIKFTILPEDSTLKISIKGLKITAGPNLNQLVYVNEEGVLESIMERGVGKETWHTEEGKQIDKSLHTRLIVCHKLQSLLSYPNKQSCNWNGNSTVYWPVEFESNTKLTELLEKEVIQKIKDAKELFYNRIIEEDDATKTRKSEYIELEERYVQKQHPKSCNISPYKPPLRKTSIEDPILVLETPNIKIFKSEDLPELQGSFAEMTANSSVHSKLNFPESFYKGYKLEFNEEIPDSAMETYFNKKVIPTRKNYQSQRSMESIREGDFKIMGENLYDLQSIMKNYKQSGSIPPNMTKKSLDVIMDNFFKKIKSSQELGTTVKKNTPLSEIQESYESLNFIDVDSVREIVGRPRAQQQNENTNLHTDYNSNDPIWRKLESIEKQFKKIISRDLVDKSSLNTHSFFKSPLKNLESLEKTQHIVASEPKHAGIVKKAGSPPKKIRSVQEKQSPSRGLSDTMSSPKNYYFTLPEHNFENELEHQIEARKNQENIALGLKKRTDREFVKIATPGIEEPYSEKASPLDLDTDLKKFQALRNIIDYSSGKNNTLKSRINNSSEHSIIKRYLVGEFIHMEGILDKSLSMKIYDSLRGDNVLKFVLKNQDESELWNTLKCNPFKHHIVCFSEKLEQEIIASHTRFIEDIVSKKHSKILVDFLPSCDIFQHKDAVICLESFLESRSKSFIESVLSAVEGTLLCGIAFISKFIKLLTFFLEVGGFDKLYEAKNRVKRIKILINELHLEWIEADSLARVFLRLETFLKQNAIDFRNLSEIELSELGLLCKSESISESQGTETRIRSAKLEQINSQTKKLDNVSSMDSSNEDIIDIIDEFYSSSKDHPGDTIKGVKSFYSWKSGKRQDKSLALTESNSISQKTEPIFARKNNHQRQNEINIVSETIKTIHPPKPKFHDRKNVILKKRDSSKRRMKLESDSKMQKDKKKSADKIKQRNFSKSKLYSKQSRSPLFRDSKVESSRQRFYVQSPTFKEKTSIPRPINRISQAHFKEHIPKALSLNPSPQSKISEPQNLPHQDLLLTPSEISFRESPLIFKGLTQRVKSSAFKKPSFSCVLGHQILQKLFPKNSSIKGNMLDIINPIEELDDDIVHNQDDTWDAVPHLVFDRILNFIAEAEDRLKSDITGMRDLEVEPFRILKTLIKTKPEVIEPVIRLYFDIFSN